MNNEPSIFGDNYRPLKAGSESSSVAGEITHFLSHDKKNLYFLSASHEPSTYNPTCPAALEALQKYSPRAVVLETRTEGKYNPPRLIEAAKNYHDTSTEVLFTAYHANTKRIPVIGGEPSDEAIFNKLSNQTTDLVTLCVLRQIAFMNQHISVITAVRLTDGMISR